MMLLWKMTLTDRFLELKEGPVQKNSLRPSPKSTRNGHRVYLLGKEATGLQILPAFKPSFLGSSRVVFGLGFTLFS